MRSTLASAHVRVGPCVCLQNVVPEVRCFSRAAGKSVRVFSTPRPLLKLASAADRLVRRRKAKLTRDRVSYFCHPDWVSHKPPPPALWTPSVPTPQALAQTAAWYRAAGLL